MSLKTRLKMSLKMRLKMSLTKSLAMPHHEFHYFCDDYVVLTYWFVI